MPEPTAEEAKNGWTEETLTKYLEEQDRALNNASLGFMMGWNDRRERGIANRPMTTSNSYDPFSW